MKLSIDTLLIKYKKYFESWLNQPVESITQAQGIHISSSEHRNSKPARWILYIPVCAFEFEKAVIISCIPEWENEIKSLLTGVSTSESITRLKSFTKAKETVTDAHYYFYGIDIPNKQIDTTDVFLLNEKNYEQYLAYYKQMFPAQSELINPDEWMTQGYLQALDKKVHFCIAVDGNIVCATDSEGIPNEPEGIINLGVNTLKVHRRKGYASATCAAFIEYHMQHGKNPVWQCAFDNLESQGLAQKLGFQLIGNVYYIASLLPEI